ncbi:MAG: hypothetical protein IKY91_02600 [Akkermansia sp.]|nr:hypothetical protein [Akkermansia sp.]
MAEYIERDAVFKFADAIERDFLERNERPVFDLEGVRYLAQQLPSADVVPVVRCKDCKHYYRPLQWPVEYTKGLCDVELFERRVHPDDLCSYGERKEADGK